MPNDRRSFVTNGLLGAGAIALANTPAAKAESRKNPSGVSGYDYQLPAFPKGTRFLFQGDSITDMKWGRNQKDRNHYLGHSYVYLIASRLGVDMPHAKLEFFNRGMSGHKVSDLKKRWQKDTIDLKPDILSILIGVNDVGRGTPTAEWESTYRALLDETKKGLPKTRLVLMDPFVLRVTRLDNDTAWKRWRGEVDRQRAIVKQMAKDYSAVHIRTQDVFDAASKDIAPSHWIWDGVHPLPEGHELIARNWLQTVSQQMRFD